MSDTPPDPSAEPEPDADKPAAPLSGRDLQENQGPLDAPPGSDADQAAEVPHVG